MHGGQRCIYSSAYKWDNRALSESTFTPVSSLQIHSICLMSICRCIVNVHQFWDNYMLYINTVNNCDKLYDIIP